MTDDGNPSRSPEEIKAKRDSDIDEIIKEWRDMKARAAEGETEISSFLRATYAETGQWARHFSSVRMTVTPFLIGISLGVMSFGWSKDDKSTFMFMSAVVWILMFVLMFIFTGLTHYWGERQRTVRKKLEERTNIRFDGSTLLPNHERKAKSDGDFAKLNKSVVNAIQSLEKSQDEQGRFVGKLLRYVWANVLDGAMWVVVCLSIAFGVVLAARQGHLWALSSNDMATVKVAQWLPATQPSMMVAFSDPPKRWPAIKVHFALGLPATRPAAIGPPQALLSIHDNRLEMISLPPTWSLLQANFESTPTTTRPASSKLPNASLSIHDNRIEIKAPPTNDRRFHILRLGLLGLDWDLSIPLKDDPPPKAKSASK